MGSVALQEEKDTRNVSFSHVRTQAGMQPKLKEGFHQNVTMQEP